MLTLTGAMEIIKTLAATNDSITIMLPEEERNYVQPRHQAISRLMAAWGPSLSSDLTRDDIIRTLSRRPTSAEGPPEDLFSPEIPRTAAFEFPALSVRTSPVWLQGHASESPGIAQGTSAKQLQAICNRQTTKQGAKDIYTSSKTAEDVSFTPFPASSCTKRLSRVCPSLLYHEPISCPISPHQELSGLNIECPRFL